MSHTPAIAAEPKIEKTRTTAPRMIHRLDEGTATNADRITSTTPTNHVIGRDGTEAIKTNPVKNVPTNAPPVPTADNEPTTDPVDDNEVSWILAASGVTIERTAAGAKKPIAANPTVVIGDVPRRDGPTMYTSAGERTASTAARASTGPSELMGSVLNAYQRRLIYCSN